MKRVRGGTASTNEREGKGEQLQKILKVSVAKILQTVKEEIKVRRRKIDIRNKKRGEK